MKQHRFIPLRDIRLGAVRPAAPGRAPEAASDRARADVGPREAPAGRAPRTGLLAVLQAWSAVARAPLSQRAVPSEWRDGILTLTVQDPGWRSTLQKLAPALCAEINAWLGGEVVAEIRTRGGGAAGG